LVLLAVLAVMVVVVVALPSSLVTRFLPRGVTARDFSGTLWHGSAGAVAIESRNAGAFEWRLRPWSLLRLAVVADLHWVKVGFVADGTVDVTPNGMTVRNLQGGGPIEDLRDFGVAVGWRGASDFKFSELKVSFAAAAGGSGFILKSAVGDLNVLDLSSPQVANGADLGGYDLHFADVAITPGADATAELADNGGPLEVQASIHLSADGRTGMLTGTIRARPEASPALRAQVASLGQLHAYDAKGRIPVDLEFTL
jgi:hypothetical protein